MEWIERLNKAVEYIEMNLEDKIDYAEASKIACCSVYHFQRMFSYIAGVTLGEYIRRRKMTKAAFELQRSDIKILELSVKYGYDSPTSFSRAFQSIHKISPSATRNKNIILKTYPKLIFSLSIKGEEELEYYITEKNSFDILGIGKKIEFNMEENFLSIPKFWNENIENEKIKKILEYNKRDRNILGVSLYKNNEIWYYIAVLSDYKNIDGMENHKINESMWAVFKCMQPFSENLQKIYRRFYTEWLPYSGYTYGEIADIEIYPDNDEKSMEVWFSIK
ncbi:effector binding domain-containing protein [Fusobacterium sp.]|uniref:AraC family transcriptional regulator n=1 Tax=Fusobacterium sp. TaxID=68766 RepID=UPI002903A0B1|nr:effector binding domain-containing protein [Fusobacterium sp.]MDU1909647.1 effector binding domain-containing protein [Fusobacterium sp.]